MFIDLCIIYINERMAANIIQPIDSMEEQGTEKNSIDPQSTYIGARHMIVNDAFQRAHYSV